MNVGVGQVLSICFVEIWQRWTCGEALGAVVGTE